MLWEDALSYALVANASSCFAVGGDDAPYDSRLGLSWNQQQQRLLEWQRQQQQQQQQQQRQTNSLLAHPSGMQALIDTQQRPYQHLQPDAMPHSSTREQHRLEGFSLNPGLLPESQQPQQEWNLSRFAPEPRLPVEGEAGEDLHRQPANTLPPSSQIALHESLRAPPGWDSSGGLVQRTASNPMFEASTWHDVVDLTRQPEASSETGESEKPHHSPKTSILVASLVCAN